MSIELILYYDLRLRDLRGYGLHYDVLHHDDYDDVQYLYPAGRGLYRDALDDPACLALMVYQACSERRACHDAHDVLVLVLYEPDARAC